MTILEQFEHWANGYGVIRHSREAELCVHETLNELQTQGAKPEYILELLCAADKLANAAMWLVVHMTYAEKVKRSANSPILNRKCAVSLSMTSSFSVSRSNNSVPTPADGSGLLQRKFYLTNVTGIFAERTT